VPAGPVSAFSIAIRSARRKCFFKIPTVFLPGIVTGLSFRYNGYEKRGNRQSQRGELQGPMFSSGRVIKRIFLCAH